MNNILITKWPAEKDATLKKPRVKRDQDPEKKTGATEEIEENESQEEAALVTELREVIEIEAIEMIETEIEKAEVGTEEIVIEIMDIAGIVTEIEIVKDATEVVQEKESITAIVRINIDRLDMNHTTVINRKEKKNLQNKPMIWVNLLLE